MGKRVLRVVVGFLVSPVLPCLCASLFVGAAGLESALRGSWFLVLMSWGLSLFFAVPAYIGLQKEGYVSAVQSLLSGLVLGFASSFVVALLGVRFWGPGDALRALVGCFGFGALGAATGLAFWVLACWTPHSKRQTLAPD